MFSKETEYALRSLVYIQAQNMGKRRPGVDEIAKATEAPRHYTAKILHRLVKDGYLLSMKGKGGGFFLDTEMANTSILRIINATEGAGLVVGCIFGLKNCDSANPCPFHGKYSGIRSSLEHMLSTETLSSLAENYPVYNSMFNTQSSF